MREGQAMTFIAALIVGAGALLATDGVAASGRPNVTVDVVAMKQMIVKDTATGREEMEFKKADTTGPGDTLLYRIVYRNEGTAEARDAQVVDPIPAGTVLVPGSWDTEGGEFMVSIDGGRSFEAYPARRAVTQADGTSRLEDVALSSYTHVRWTTKEPLAPGASRTTSFKVTVR